MEQPAGSGKKEQGLKPCRLQGPEAGRLGEGVRGWEMVPPKRGGTERILKANGRTGRW